MLDETAWDCATAAVSAWARGELEPLGGIRVSQYATVMAGSKHAEKLAPEYCGATKNLNALLEPTPMNRFVSATRGGFISDQLPWFVLRNRKKVTGVITRPL